MIFSLNLSRLLYCFSFTVLLGIAFIQSCLAGESFVKNEILLTTDEEVLKLATESLKGGSLLPIKESLQAIIKQNDTSANAHYWLGRIHLETGDNKAAINSYKLSVKYNPYRADVRVELAKVLTLEGEVTEALDELNKVLSAQPVNLDARDALASAYAKQGSLNHAIQEYIALVRLAPNHPLSQIAKTKLETLYFRISEDIALHLEDEVKKNKAIKMSNIWISQELLDPAHWLLTKLYKIAEDNLEVNYLLGILYTRRGQLQLALKYLSFVVEADPKNINYRLAYADVLSRGGYLEQAEKNYLVVVEQEKDDEIKSEALNKVYLVRGEKLIRRGFFQTAINYYKKLLASDNQNPVLLTRIANIYMSQGNAKEANEFSQLKEKIDRKAKEKIYYQKQGRNFFLAGKYAEARFAYDKLIELNPKSSQAYYWVSKIYEREGKYDIAIEFMKKGIKYAPLNLSLKKEYGRLLVSSKKLTLASQYYASLAESATSEIEKAEFRRLSKFVEGQELLQNQQMQKALSHYQSMSLQFRNDVPVLEALANVYVKLQFYPEAEAAYFSALKIDKKRASTYLRLAGLYSVTQDNEKRLENYTRALQLDPLGSIGRKALDYMLSSAQTNLDLGNYELADREYQAVLAILPNNIVAASSAALIATKMRRSQYAEMMYTRILQNDPNNMKVRVQFGHMYVAAGNFAAAIAEFETIVRLRPSSVEGKEATANLNVIYNAKADEIISKLKHESEKHTSQKNNSYKTTNEKLLEAIDTAREWIETKKQITPAQKILKAVLEMDSDNGQAHYWIGSIYDQYRLFDLALEHIGISVSITPDNLQLLSAFGRVLARSGNLDAAQAVYTNVIIESRGTPLAIETRALRGYVVGLRLMNQKRYTDALAHYKAMEIFQPDDTNLQMRIGNVHLNMGQLDEAEKIFSLILSREPDNPSVHLKLAEIYHKAGNQSKYYQALRMAIFLDTEGIVARSALDKLGFAQGLYKLKEKRWDEALITFNKILDTNPDNLQAMLGIASAYFGKGDYTKSESLFLRILKDEPSNIDARLKIARLYTMTQRIRLAVAELERIVSVSTETREGKEALLNLTNIYRQRGAAFLAKGKGDEAVIEYRKSVSRDKDDWQAHHALGDIFKSASTNTSRKQAEKFIDIAILHYKETVRIKPDTANAYISLGTIYEGRQKFQLAMEVFVNALSHVEADKEELINILANAVRMQIVRQEYKAQNMLWVVAELNDMLKAEPNSSRIYLFLSSVYIWLDDVDNAIVALKKVAELTPENINSQFRLGQLYEQTNDLSRAAAVYRDIIFSSQTGGIVGATRERLISVEEKMQFLTIRMRYTNALAEAQVGVSPKSSSFSSALNVDMIARIRPRKGVELSFNANPSYSSFHDTEGDALTSSYGVTANLNDRKGYIILNANQSETQGLLTEEVRGTDKTFSLTQGLRIRMPSFLSGPGSVMRSTLQANASYRKFVGTDFTRYDVRVVSASGLYSHPFRTGGSLSSSYQFSDTGNLKPPGMDYANKSHLVSLRIDRPLASRLSGYLSTSVSYERYKNYDSIQYSPFSPLNLLGPVLKKRRTGQIGFRTGLRYQIHRKLSFTLDAAYSINKTTINRTKQDPGYIFNEAGKVDGIKSASLADYTSARVSTGFQFQF